MKEYMTRGFKAGFAAMAFAFAFGARADAPITLSGIYTTDQVFACTSDTTVNLNGAVFVDCSLKLGGDVTFTLNLVDGTQNSFGMLNANAECIKATRASNIVVDGTGSLELLSEKRITDKGGRSGVLVCNDLTVRGGNVKVTFDKDKSDTSCIFLKGNYLQTGGKVKVDLNKKNCTNELHGITFDTAGTTFTLEDGEFNAEIAGTKSRAIDLKGSGRAIFRGGKVKAEFEGPEGRFVSGGALIRFEGGSYSFSTNVTSKMTAAYYPTKLGAVKAKNVIEIAGGKFEADLPTEGSEIFTNDSDDGTDIRVSGGELDLVAGNDCIHAKEDIVISGGKIRAVSVSDDGIDANGSLTISGGDVWAFATAPGTHAFDVNNGKLGDEKKTLTISGGLVIGTDGLDAIPIGDSSSEVGKVNFVQPTYYGADLPTDSYGGKYLTVAGATNGVPFAVKPRLPDLPAGRTFNLLVSAPGRTASSPVPQTVQEAYADCNTLNPLVFDRKATVSGQTVTTKEGDVLVLPDYYDLEPAEGKTKTVSLALNAKACELDGFSVGESVTVGVRTRTGLRYGLQKAAAPDGTWTDVGGKVAGDGKVASLSTAKTGARGFYRAVATDVK